MGEEGGCWHLHGVDYSLHQDLISSVLAAHHHSPLLFGRLFPHDESPLYPSPSRLHALLFVPPVQGFLIDSYYVLGWTSALVEPSAEFKIVEMIAKTSAPPLSLKELFSSID